MVNDMQVNNVQAVQDDIKTDDIASVKSDVNQPDSSLANNMDNSLDSGYTEEISDDVIEYHSSNKKSITFLDTLTLQAIICILIGIGYLFINMFLPTISVEIYNTYIQQVSTESDTYTFTEAVQSIVEFINSTPLKSND